MSNHKTINVINKTLSAKQDLESQISALTETIIKLESELTRSVNETSSITLSGSDYIWVPNQLAIAFANDILSTNQTELASINLKLSAIGALLGSNNE